MFLDEMGPATFLPGQGIDVRPHPHINLATLTYLLEGEIVHRDSLGTEQRIRPGQVNWMSAGRGIVHSERTDPALRAVEHRMHGLQLWAALPREHEESEPAFVHYGEDALPVALGPGYEARVVAGDALARRSPLRALAEVLLVDVRLEPQAELAWLAAAAEEAIYVVQGQVEVEGATLPAGNLGVLASHHGLTLRAREPSRFVVLGGAPLDGPRHLWWNFVSSRAERLEQAREDWKEGRFPSIPGDAAELIPLPLP